MLFSRFPHILVAVLTLAAANVTLLAESSETISHPPSAIDEAGFITIGGIEQWITIKGEHRENPVILFVHGGPGNPMSPWSRSLYSDWEDDFSIVQWDQRYAGKTFERNEQAVELTIERFNEVELTVEMLVQDGLEVSEYLIQHLDKQKILLTGTSWGSVVSVHMAQARPDLFHAYVGMSQFVNYERNMAVAYQQILEVARKHADTKAIAQLESLGPPPWENPKNFGVMRRIIRRYERKVTSAHPELVAAPAYDNDKYRAAYTAGEDLSFLKFVGLKNDGMASTINLTKLGTEFLIPIFLIQGAEDLLTAPSISRSYFESITAPDKSYVLVHRGGHDPNLAMISAQFALVKEKVAPLAR